MLINVGKLVADISDKFEMCDSTIKRKYLIENLRAYRNAISSLKSYRGDFETGYPFYVLDSSLNGELPVIEEQLRYNDELRKASYEDIWICEPCLLFTGYKMPDLKQICKPCTKVENGLKPRKVINRLPDVDFWFVSDEDMIEYSKTELKDRFDKAGFMTSDVDPVDCINRVNKIATDLYDNVMPNLLLPLDAHIIGDQTLKDLISHVPYEIIISLSQKKVPYLPIHPDSLRKYWQKDDMAYNFVHDFLSSMHEHNFDENMMAILNASRKNVVSKFTFDELYKVLLETGGEVVVRRHETPVLKKTFEKRCNEWKKL